MNDRADQVLGVMKSRRVTRSFTTQPIPDDLLMKIAQAGRFAASGGNLRPHRFVITRDPETIKQIRSFSPGMLGIPQAIVAILIDHDQVRREWLSIDPSMVPYIDVGTAAQNMLNMAHALELGSCPVTSFSQSAVGRILEIPGHLTIELLIILGYPEQVDRSVNPNAPKPITTRDLTSWERFGQHAASEHKS
ncbi:hypothetical protein BH23CHL5_BH23CHL5_09870 [soil metagenome]